MILKKIFAIGVKKKVEIPKNGSEILVNIYDFNMCLILKKMNLNKQDFCIKGYTKTQISFQKDGLQLRTGPQLVEPERKSVKLYEK